MAYRDIPSAREESTASSSDCSSTITSLEDNLSVARMPTGLMIALTCGVGGYVDLREDEE